MAEYDGAIAAWGIKRLFDTARPISYIQCLYNSTSVKVYAGPYKGNEFYLFFIIISKFKLTLICRITCNNRI